jgi:hypothetical protein
MKRSILFLVLSSLLLLTPLLAPAAPSKDERNLEKEIAALDRTMIDLGAEQAVIDRISKDLTVAAEQIRTLHTQGLRYGEVIAVLSLARRMPGGITEANIERVRSLRAGPPQLGWGQVAAQIKTKLGPAVSQVRKTENEVRRTMKQGTGRAGSPREESRVTTTARKHAPLGYPGEGRALPQGRAAD